MQKNRKVFTHLTEAEVDELIRRRAHDAPVPLFVRNAELFISDSAADEVNLHCAIVPDS